MRRAGLFIVMVALALTAGAQVGTSINNENMRRGFEKDAQARQAAKNKEEKKKPKIDPSVPVDTTTLYFSLVDSAQVRLDAQRWDEAEAFIKAALESDPINPNNSLLLSNLATVQRYQGKNDEAIKNYTMALDLTPNAVTLLRNRAVLLVAQGQLEQARADYERIIALEPLDMEARYNLGLILLDGGDEKGAEASFEQILRYDSASGLGHQGLATLYKMQGNYAKAISHYGDAIKAQPSAQLFGNRADCHLALKQLFEASDDISSALQLDAEDPFLYLLRAKLNKMRFNFDDMNRDIELAEKHGLSATDIKQLLQLD